MIHYITTNGIGNAWVAAELKEMERYGIPYALHSMRAPHQNFFGSDWARAVNEKTKLLYPLPPLELVESIALAPFRYRGRFLRALSNALFSERETPRARIAALAHLGVACLWAGRLESDRVDLIHSQWIQSGGTIGWYAAWLLGVPFSFTGHAVDLFRDRVALKDKIASADFIVAISRFHRQFYIDHGADPERIEVVYCGIDLSQYPYRLPGLEAPLRILSFGRLVEKKGFSTLIDACAVLHKRGRSFVCEIAGDGPELDMLEKQVQSLGLQDKVHLTGKPVLQEDLAEWLHRGHLFAQPCCWSHDNDVDGIPRSLMEAMACGLPSVTTPVAGIPDLVSHEQTGLMVEPNDPEGLAAALQRLMDDQTLARSISERARRHVEERFNLETCLLPLARRFAEKLGQRLEPVAQPRTLAAS